MKTAQGILRAIMAHDPDGKECEPTEADYAAFERWVIETYGRDAWREYQAGGWGSSETDWV